VARKSWTYSEEKILIDHYNNKTISELISMLPGRDQDAINSKIKRLKKQNRIVSGKSADTVARAYTQR